MCRVEAQEAWAQADAMKAAGASRIVTLVKEDTGSEVADFRAKFWGGEVMLDAEQKFYIALGGGKPWKPYSGVAAFLAALLNPFSKNRLKASLKAAKAVDPGNMVGEGFVAGGWYVIAANGEPTYSFLEGDLGDKAPMPDVIAAVAKAAGKPAAL